MLSTNLHDTRERIIAVQLSPPCLHSLDGCSPLLELRVPEVIDTIKLTHHCIVRVSLEVATAVGDLLKLKLEALEVYILCSSDSDFELMPVAD